MNSGYFPIISLPLRQRDKCPISTGHPKARVQCFRGVYANCGRWRLVLREKLNVSESKVLARRLGVAFDDDGLCVLDIWETGVVPARLAAQSQQNGGNTCRKRDHSR